MKRFAAIFVLLLLSSDLYGQTFSPLLDASTRDLLHESLSGELAKDHVYQITRHHRIQGSRGYRASAHYVLQQLRGYGFSEKDAYIESFKSDGKIEYQTWQSPSGWDVESAELRMIEPYEEYIVGYPEIAISLIIYSNPGNVEAELVWVGTGTRDEDYAGKEVRGKFVLATGYGSDVHRLAVLKYGAKAVVCYLNDDRAKEYPDMIEYSGMWPRADELERTTFGFNLSNRQGTKLRELLEQRRKVVLRGTVKGIGLEPYFMDVVVARIPGSERPEEELVFSAHLDHPKESANDNASGSAAILDIARTLKELIESGRLPQPKRSLRFMWVPEWHGTMAYIDAHPELVGPTLGGKFLANMNLDMVGENLELLHSKLIITRTPWSLPSVVNDVVENMAQMVDGMNVRTPRGSKSLLNYRMLPYSGGSDHMMFIDRKIPAVMLSHDPDYTHHTSEDTPDKVDPVQLERCEIIAASTIWYLANLTAPQAVDLTYLASARASQRLGDAARTARQIIADAADASLAGAWYDAENLLRHAAAVEREALRSILTFNEDRSIGPLIDQMEKAITQNEESYRRELRKETTARGYRVPKRTVPQTPIDDRIPIRLTRGPLDFGLPGNKLPPEEADWYRAGNLRMSFDTAFELVNYIDGKRTISEIRDALDAQFGPVKLESVARYLDDLVKVGVLGWKKSGKR